ncbi:uncharacterized protein C2845_PM02G02130 [Panicum miliaceum]|uniref:PB1 domain-containing protein n=1 Tax=Panicum miliaceum TaxID=4540 RepID=A0A3L6SB16_PANMI|nr:uncharacterized protein C2845_PM02G02130 [Panicum miliaceum]
MAAAVAAAGLDARMKLLCSHGGRLVPRGGPDGALRHRLADDEGLEDVLVSVTCDEELAHMRDEYDRLPATRPGARFRVFVITTAASAGSGGGGGGVYKQTATVMLPPLAPALRRVQSERAMLHRRLAYPAPVRRVQSAQEFAGDIHAQQPFHHHRHLQCCCSCRRQSRDLCAPAPMPARPMNAVPYMPKKATAAPSMPAAKATGRVVFTKAAREMATSRDAQAAMEERRAIWEFE